MRDAALVGNRATRRQLRKRGTIMENTKTIAILGINGHLGHSLALAALRAGWRVIGFGRSNKHPLPGVEFVAGDANSVADLARATREAAVVLNALNLPYHKWGDGAAEALLERVLSAAVGKTLLFPGNIYNYRATDRVITPDLRQDPETERGAIRVRMEHQLAAAAGQGKLQVIILRAGNFYGSELPGGWFDQLLLREAAKHRVALNPAHSVKNAWAYLPDLVQAFVALAEERTSFGAFENFHFAGHLVSADETFAAMQRAVPHELERVGYPWLLLRVMGLFMPTLRGLVQMRYLWENELGLSDRRLEALLGQHPGTPFEEAIATTVAHHFALAHGGDESQAARVN
jgi:nucleoside-diphosphate-sugar epimerase